MCWEFYGCNIIQKRWFLVVCAHGAFTEGHWSNVTVVNKTMHTFLLQVMQKVVCQMSRMAEYVGRQYLNDIQHPLRFWSGDFLSHETVRAEELPYSKLKNKFWWITIENEWLLLNLKPQLIVVVKLYFLIRPGYY